MSSLKFGLNIQKKPQLGSTRPAPARKPLFGGDDADEEAGAKDANGAAQIGTFDLDGNASKPLKGSGGDQKVPLKPTSKNKPPVSQYGDLSSLQTQRKRAQEATTIDPSIYDYDAAYDALHAKTAAKKAAERAEAEERKPKYMENLLAAAEVRKRDQLRAKDKLLQRERETEGEEFADKEKFVTEAYKQQQEEVRRMEEEEKRREEAEERKNRGKGMREFYRSIIDAEEQKHREAVAAIAEAKEPGTEPIATEEPTEKTELDIAKELNAKGANILINEEGQIADKRQLLSAGLNVVAKPKTTTDAPSASSRSSSQQQSYQGRNASQKAMRERQTRMLEAQLEQAAKRAADDEEEERRKLEHTAKSRKTEGDVSSARERYLQRKREAAAAAAAGKGSA